MINKLKRFFKKERGQGLVEYGLILALISVMSIGAVSSVGGSVKEIFQGIGEAVIIPPALNDSGYIWVREEAGGYTSTNPEHTGRGYYKYIDDELDVEIPHTIHGHKMTSYYKMFRGSQVAKVSHNNPRVTSMTYMFLGSTSTDLNLDDLETRHVTSMMGMFEDSHVRSLDLRSFDTQKVRNMAVMFFQSSIEYLDLSSFDTSNVITTERMFHDANRLTEGFARNQDEADKMNATTQKPDALSFTIKGEE